MDSRESPETQAFRAEAADFVAARLPPDIRAKVLGFLRIERQDYVRWQQLLNEHGWGAPGWPREHGGPGWDARQRTLFEEECFVAGAPRQMPFGLSMVGPVLQAFGSEEQQKRFLPRILTMEDWWCQGYSEPGAGSDLASLTTRAERRDDVYIVNGQKTWTSPRVRVNPIRTLDEGADVNEVFLDDVAVPVANLVGEENRGWTIAKFLLGHERTTIAGIGAGKRLLVSLKELARSEPKRGLPLIEDPRFRDRIVKVEIDIRAHEWSLMRASSLEQAGKSIGAEASRLKIGGWEIQQELAQLLMECAGPYAIPYLPEALNAEFAGETADGRGLNALAAQYLDLRKVSIYGGTNEVQKNLIARALLGNLP